MKDLKELAIKYSSDKYYWHSYIPVYQKLFEGLHVHRLLEIGIGHESLMKPFLPEGVPYVHGSSLLMWQEFFEQAAIYACDIREDTLVNQGRIRSVVCDQNLNSDLWSMVDAFGRLPFDVIIDDGCHEWGSQVATAIFLLPHLAANGLYIIEDIWEKDAVQMARLFKGEVIKGEHGRDDNMVVVRR